jgi:hypothetical protein
VNCGEFAIRLFHLAAASAFLQEAQRPLVHC